MIIRKGIKVKIKSLDSLIKLFGIKDGFIKTLPNMTLKMQYFCGKTVTVKTIYSKIKAFDIEESESGIWSSASIDKFCS